MNNDQRESFALLKFRLISPVLNGLVEKKSTYFQKVALETYDIPGVGKKNYSPKTIQNWFYDYLNGGFDALKPKRRSDKGTSRTIDAALAKRLINLRKNNLDISCTLFREKLIKDGHIYNKEVSYSTLYRFLKKHKLLKSNLVDPKPRKRFAYKKVNVLWQGDLMYSVYLKDGKRKRQTYLIVFLDDASRIITGAKFSFTQNFEALRKVIVSALNTRGLPSIIYVDNGKIYRSQRLQLGLATLGISLVNTAPYDP